MKASLSRLFQMAGEYRGKMIGSVSFATLSVALGVAPLFIMYRVIAELLQGNASFQSTCTLAVIAGICLILKSVTFARATYMSHRVAYRILRNLRIQMAEKFVNLPLGFLTGRDSGALKKAMVDDIEKLELFLAHNIPETISSMAIPLFVTIFMFFLDWRMALALLCTIPVSLIAFAFMMRGYQPKMERYNRSMEHVNATIVEYIKGIAVIKTFNQTTRSFGKFRKAVSDYFNYTMEWFRESWPHMTAYYVLIAAGTVIVLPVGGYLYLGGTLELPVYILFLLISLGFSAPLIKLTEFMDGIAIVASCEENVDKILHEQQLETAENTSMPEAYDVSFSDVCFSYDKKEVLRDISFSLRQGSTTALVGPSGAGKSTVAKLIARFWDVSSGSVSIGGINIRDIEPEALMEIVSFVFQDVFLFNDSIMENIRIGRKGASDDEVVEAAKLAMCHEFIIKTENGYDTCIGDSGCKLSGGERQRISIARAILRDTPIVVLDEATAYADPENEDKIQESINNLTKDKTLITIAHRLSTIMHSDEILVFDEGCIAGKGKHQELLDSCSLYKNMWNAHIASMDWQFNVTGEESNV